MKYYIIAGERSGDLHGSNLMKALLQLRPVSQFRGFGGDEMRKAGATLVMHYHQLAFMGFEAILNFFRIARYMKNCQRDILAYKPNAIILIDYGGFNRQMAAFGKRHGIPVFYYIPPKVWAWRQSRAWQLKRTVTRLFVILPFEKEFFAKYNIQAAYVGNPVLDAIRSFVPRSTFLSEFNLHAKSPLVALLPGSRKMELTRIVPVMAEVARSLPGLHFAVGAIREMEDHYYEPLRSLSNVTFVYDATYDLLSHAQAAIVTSGTATLETALFKVPQVVVYKSGVIEYIIARSVIQVSFISLVNLIAGKPVVAELIQSQASAANIRDEVLRLIGDTDYRDNMVEAYSTLHQRLDVGSASENTARLIEEYWRNP